MFYTKLKSPTRGVKEIPVSQFELSPRQLVVLIGVDFDSLGGLTGFENENPDITTEHIGKLSEQNFIFESQLRNSLSFDGFPLKDCPDPEVMLLTRKENPQPAPKPKPTFEILPKDRLFYNSPDTGIRCKCSRCGKPIMSGVPIRVWPTKDGESDNTEYRFHPECLGLN